MQQGSTPTIPLTIKGVDVTEARIFLTILDDLTKKKITLVSGEDFTASYDQVNHNTVFEIELSQAQTLGLSAGTCTMQARWAFPDGKTGGTGKAKVNVSDVIYGEEIAYDRDG